IEISNRSSSSATTSRTCSESKPRSAMRSLASVGSIGRRLTFFSTSMTPSSMKTEAGCGIGKARKNSIRRSGNDNGRSDKTVTSPPRYDGVQMIRSWTLALAIVLGAGAPAAAQIDPQTALVERAAWNALNAGQARAAADAFRTALAADPKNARLHLGAGMAAALERRDTDAKDEFERALALDPKLSQARALLGQMQYRMGDKLGARRTVETLR